MDSGRLSYIVVCGYRVLPRVIAGRRHTTD